VDATVLRPASWLGACDLERLAPRLVVRASTMGDG
jgi:hypothetical protein